MKMNTALNSCRLKLIATACLFFLLQSHSPMADTNAQYQPRWVQFIEEFDGQETRRVHLSWGFHFSEGSGIFVIVCEPEQPLIEFTLTILDERLGKTLMPLHSSWHKDHWIVDTLLTSDNGLEKLVQLTAIADSPDQELLSEHAINQRYQTFYSSLRPSLTALLDVVSASENQIIIGASLTLPEVEFHGAIDVDVRLSDANGQSLRQLAKKLKKICVL